MYGNNILNFQESTTILNVCKKTSENLLNAPRINFGVLLNFKTIFVEKQPWHC